MKKKGIFWIAGLGLIFGGVAAWYFSLQHPAQAPVFIPASSPYESAIFANGIIESTQGSGSNINIYPEVASPIVKVLVREGQIVKVGAPLIVLDDTVQRATTKQLHLQAEAAKALLEELHALPRPEALDIAKAQVAQGEANLKAASDQYAKRKASYELDARSISKDVLDIARDTVLQTEAALKVAERQLQLTQAGAWTYDIQNQEKQVQSLFQSYEASKASLDKYVIRARVEGVVLAVNASPGSYAMAQGTYNPYTQNNDPLIIMGALQDSMSVRCFVDEVLVSRLPDPQNIQAEMTLQGSNQKVKLTFDRIQPILTPKIELANQRQEKVDLRVLPVIFKFLKPEHTAIYPGQLVDVYIGKK
jgi:HlyD family secretion protein